MAILLTTEGEFKLQEDISLEALQGCVGGLIQLVSRSSVTLVVNDEGIPLQLPINQMASNIAGFPILGPVVLLSKFEMKGF